MISYWVLFIGIAVVSWLVQMNLQNKFKKYSKIPTGNGMTGRDVAIKMLLSYTPSLRFTVLLAGL